MGTAALVVDDPLSLKIREQFLYDTCTFLGLVDSDISLVESSLASRSWTEDVTIVSPTLTTTTILANIKSVGRPTLWMDGTESDTQGITQDNMGANGFTNWRYLELDPEYINLIPEGIAPLDEISGQTPGAGNRGYWQSAYGSGVPVQELQDSTGYTNGLFATIAYLSDTLLFDGTAWGSKLVLSAILHHSNEAGVNDNTKLALAQMLTWLGLTSERMVSFTTDLHLKATITKNFSTNFEVAVLGDKNFTTDFLLKDSLIKTFTTDFHLAKQFGGFSTDFIADFEGEFTKEFTTDLWVKNLDNTKTFSTDFNVVEFPYLDFTTDVLLAKADVVTFNTDFNIVRAPTIEFSTDFMVEYGPDIDISLGDLMAKWEVKGYDMKPSSLTREYYRVPVYAEEQGTQIDPTTYTVEFALTENDSDGQPVEPEDNEWVAGSWETNTAVEPNIYYSQILLGTGGSIPLVDGNFHIWWRISASTEAPVRLLGRVDVS